MLPVDPLIEQTSIKVKGSCTQHSMVQVLIINDGAGEWYLPPALSQCQCYCDDKADTPTSGFPLHSFISMLQSTSILVHFSLVNSICSYYSTPFNIKPKNKLVISLSYPAEKPPYSSLTCDMSNVFLIH